MKRAVACLLAFLAVAMAWGHGVRTRPILGDDQLYFFMAERAASGVPPHVAQMEVKTQLPTMIGGAAIAAGRALGMRDVHSGRVATTIAAAVSTVLAWLLSARLVAVGPAGAAGRTAVAGLTGAAGAASTAGVALVGAAAFLSIYGVFLEAAAGFQPKLFMVAFLLGAHLASACRRHAAAGALAMAAFLCWQPAALVAGACGLAVLVDARATWRDVARLLAGAVAVLGAYEAWFWWVGALEAQLHQEWVLAFGADAARKVLPWSERIWFVLTEAQAFRPRPNGLPSAFVAAASAGVLAALAAPRRAWAAARTSPGLVSFWSAASVATAFTVYDHQAHPDMLLVQPYFAVGAALGAARVAGWLARLPRGGALAAASTTIFVAAGLADAALDVARAWRGRTGLDRQVAEARLVSLYTDHRGSLYVLGGLHLLALLHQDNWTNVGNVGHESRQFDMKTYRPLRDGRMPEVIVASRGLRPGGTTWLPREYVDVTPRLLADDRVRLYLRMTPAEPGLMRGSAPRPKAPPAKSPTLAKKPPPPAK